MFAKGDVALVKSGKAGLPDQWPAKLLCVAREVILHARFLRGKAYRLWQIKRWSKPKPFSVWFSRNLFGSAAKPFFGLHLLLGNNS